MKKYMYIILCGMIVGCFILYFLVNQCIISNNFAKAKEVIKIEYAKDNLSIENKESNHIVLNDIARNSLNSLNKLKAMRNDGENNLNESKEKVEIEVNKEVKEKEDVEDQQNKEKKHETLIKKVIVIDPGHASRTSLEKEPNAPGSNIMKVKESGGAQGAVTHTPEYVINMHVAIKLKNELEKLGYVVIMTKDKNEIMLGNIQRAVIGNKANADLVIRIHADSSGSSSVKGTSMLVPANTKYTKPIYEQSKKYGQVILNALVNNVGMKNRGIVERNDLTGFNWSNVPIVLIEMGFLSNPEEDRLLCTEHYQNKITKGVVEGVNKIFNH
jgi:N-acetylmuramoyl-L-alanine amidase